jgi:hypothetical protein
VAEITFRLSKREAKALTVDRSSMRGVRVPQARLSAEFKMRQAIWSAFPELRDQAEGEGSRG